MALNVLFLMVDQMQARVLDEDSCCRTPNLDRLARRGVRFARATTPNPVCSPARASLMTGLLPHNHGVTVVTHTVDQDQCRLRSDKPHWAQRLADAGYNTAYFGKWHVEHDEAPGRFGWATDGSLHSEMGRRRRQETETRGDSDAHVLARRHHGPPGYQDVLHYAVTRVPPERRSMGVVTGLAKEWLASEAFDRDRPWCAFVSLAEPHDPYVCGEAAYAAYDVDSLPISPSARDDLLGRPALYRKSARQWRELSDRERREATACYFGSITELDSLLGEVVDCVAAAGQLDDTIVVFTSDHGELMGAHGLYTKNIMAAEECYNIPLLAAGPGIPAGQVMRSRVSSMDIGPTLLDLVGEAALPDADGSSFAGVLTGEEEDGRRRWAFAENSGGRYLVTQRIVWDDNWKLVFNGFDEDELYDLDADPHEMANRIDDPALDGRVRAMMARMWGIIRDTGDTSLLNTDYGPLRLARYGPGIAVGS